MNLRIFLLIPAIALGLSSCDKLKLAKKAEATVGPGVHELAASEYDSFIATHDKLVIVDFYADWCGPCRQLGPVLEKVAGEFDKDVVLGKVNVDQARELAGKLGVTAIPDVRLYRDGVMVDRFQGTIPEAELREKVNRHTFGLGAKSGTPKEGEEGKVEPAIRPMEKDWLPPGVERK